MDVTLPEDLSILSDDELAELDEELTAEFDRLRDEGSKDVPALTELAEAIDRVRGESSARIQAEAEADAAVAELAARVHPDADPLASDEPPDDEPEEPDTQPDEAELEEEEPVLVTASAARTHRPTGKQVARRAPRPPVERRQPVVITAAADVPGIATGAKMDVTRVAQGFHDRARGLNDGSPRVAVARITVPLPDWQYSGTDPATSQVMLDRLIGQPDAVSLVASGGWCAPSQPIYDLFEIGDSAGLVDLPTVGAVRGGMLVPSFYGFGDVGAGALWNWTEANDIAAATQPAGPDKTCLKIPCPTWTDYRLEAEGLCVTHGNLSDRAFPELTRNYVNLVMTAHAHRVSAAKIAKIVAGATAVTPDATMTNSDAAGDVLGIVELQALDMRSRYRAGPGKAIEALFPDWIIGALRANVAKRAGVDLLSVSDQQVVGWLTLRGIRPQFLSDYQPLYNAAPSVKFPANVEVTMFFAGAYVEADGGTIDLGVVRDSTLNSTNDFTAAWSEQFFQVAPIGPTARKISIPLGIDGVTACCP